MNFQVSQEVFDEIMSENKGIRTKTINKRVIIAESGICYIICKEGRLHRVHESELHKKGKRIKDGTCVKFNTSEQLRGKYFWAYDLEIKE